MFSRRRSEPKEYEIHGRRLVCPHCQNRTFWFRRSLRVTRWMAFWSAEWWGDRSDSNFICARCGNIQWFKRSR